MDRRTLLKAACMWTPGLYAEQLSRTPGVEEGPYYPNRLPLDTDNDLVILNNNLTPAVGEVISLGGKILFPNGTPVRGAEVEIWQVDANGIYQKMATNGDAKMDPNFQGYGRFETASNGEYRFRTIQPVPYRGRSAPHIHFKIRTKSHQPWTTQLFIAGHPGNARDFLYRKIGDEAARQRVSADFSSSKVSFDIVLGWTPQD